MGELAFPLLSIAIGAPVLGAALTALALTARQRRLAALGAAGLAALACLEILRETAAAGYTALAEPGLGSLLFVDALSAAPLALFSLVTAGVIATLSIRDSQTGALQATLLIEASTLAAYAAASPLVFVLGWMVSSYALFLDRPQGEPIALRSGPAIALFASTACVTAGLAYMSVSARGVEGLFGGWGEFGGLHGPGGMAAFVLLTLAVVLRKGLFPFHSWILSAHSQGGLFPTVLLINGHLAAFLVARVVIPIFPAISQGALALISDFALCTALYAAVLALAERAPRRILALLAISQSSFVLAGLGTATPEGVSGALVYWMVVTVATTALAVVLRSVEQRMRCVALDAEFLGLAVPFPRLAAFFIICGVALVGMPGTLGFISDELLLHGALDAHPRLGLIMPIAAALNAFHLYRLFSRLFLGSPGPSVHGVPDAKLGERLALTAAAGLLVVGGLLPAHAVDLRSAATTAIVSQLDAHAPQGE